MADKTTLLERIRGNAEWEAIKVFGGSGMLSSLISVIRSAIHHDRPEWVLWGIVFALGFGLAALGYWRQGTETRSDTKESLPEEKAEDPNLTMHFQDRTARENNDALLTLGLEISLLFTPLQIEAFRLARAIKSLMVEAGEKPDIRVTPDTSHDDIWKNAEIRHLWRMKFLSAYKVRLSSRVAVLASGLWGADVGSSRLDALYAEPKNEDDLDEICKLIVRQAHLISGIRLDG